MVTTPPLNRPLPKYRLHKTTGRAVVRLGGRDFYLGPHNSRESHEKYNQVLGDWIKNGRPETAAVGSPDGITIAEVCVLYLAHVDGWYPNRSDGSPSSEPCVIRAALRPLVDLHGRTAVADFGPLALEAVQRAMIARGWCRNTVNRQIWRLKQMFKWAKNKEHTASGPFERIRDFPGLQRGRTEAPDMPPVRPVPRPAIDAILDLVSRPVRAMIELQLRTGMRPGEVCIMCGTDIQRKGEDWEYVPPAHKTAHHGHTRRIFLGPRGKTIVMEFLRPDLAAPLFCPREAEVARNEKRREQRKTPLTPSALLRRGRKDPGGRAGEMYDVAAYRRAIARACDIAFPAPPPLGRRDGETLKAWRKRLTEKQRAELTAWRRVHRWHPHQLRHNAGTELRARYGLEAARIILG